MCVDGACIVCSLNAGIEALRAPQGDTEKGGVGT